MGLLIRRDGGARPWPWSFMAPLVLVAGALTALPGGCGTLAPDGGGAGSLPTSGAGPYGRLPAADEQVLADPVADLDDPFVLGGAGITIWFTRTTAPGHSEIRRAQLADVSDRSPAVDVALAADQPWESDGVRQVAILAPSGGDGAGADGAPWLAAYASAGALGYAASDDGVHWRKAPGPALVADGGEEGGALASPALVARGDGTIRLYYLGAPGAPGASGALFVAEAAPADLRALATAPFARRPGPAGSGTRALFARGAAPWLDTLGRFTARAIRTATGRMRFDLALSGQQGGTGVVGLAASFDGLDFAFAATPLLPAAAPAEQSPCITAWQDGWLLLFVERPVQFGRIGAAAAP